MKKTNLLNMLDPFLSYIDSGDFFRKPISWLYALLAFLNPVLAISFLVILIDFFKYASGGVIVLLLFLWLVFAVVSCLGFLLWWNRMKKVSEVSGKSDNYVALPVVSHFIQTAGEWAGMFLGIFGFFASLAALISVEVSHVIPYGYGNAGVTGLVIFPVSGFLTVIFARFFAESIRALADIANNTKRVADK